MSGLQVGVTASSHIVSEQQLNTLSILLIRCGATVFHHGDCVEGDAKAHSVAKRIGLKTIGHPPENPKKRAFTENDEDRDPLPYLERNRCIVDETEHLFVLPRGVTEEIRSGTWATARYSKKVRKPRTFIWPNGEFTCKI